MRALFGCLLLATVTVGAADAQRLPRPYAAAPSLPLATELEPAHLSPPNLMTPVHGTTPGAGRSDGPSWQSRVLVGVLLGVAASAAIATGPQILCGAFGDRSSCPNYWVTVAEGCAITVPLGVVLGLAGLLPDRW